MAFRAFPALYHGTCWTCGYEWEPGEMIGYEDDNLVHEDCYELVEPAPEPKAFVAPESIRRRSVVLVEDQQMNQDRPGTETGC